MPWDHSGQGLGCFQLWANSESSTFQLGPAFPYPRYRVLVIYLIESGKKRVNGDKSSLVSKWMADWCNNDMFCLYSFIYLLFIFIFYLFPVLGGINWVWQGCSDNVAFGSEISSLFIDSLETGKDDRAAVNLHNNLAGRKVSYSVTYN